MAKKTSAEIVREKLKYKAVDPNKSIVQKGNSYLDNLSSADIIRQKVGMPISAAQNAAKIESIITRDDVINFSNKQAGITQPVQETIANRKPAPPLPDLSPNLMELPKLSTSSSEISKGYQKPIPEGQAQIKPWNQSPLEKLKSAIDSFTGNDGIPEFKKQETAMSDKLFIPEYDMTNKLDRIKAKYKLGQLADTEGLEWSKVAAGEKSAYAVRASQAIEEMYQRYPQLFDEVQAEDPSLFEKIKSFFVNIPEATAEMLPTMLGSVKAGISGGIVGAGAGAATAAIAGQLGPQVALPEELATVPAGATAGFTWGSRGGAAVYMYQVEKGQAYKSMLDDGIDPQVADRWATAVGAVNAGLEVAQLGTLLKSVGVADDAIKPIASGMLDKYLNTTGKKAAAQFVTGVATETGQEVAQEAVSIGGETGAKKQSGMDAQLFSSENGKRLLDTAIQSAQAFIGLQGAGQVGGSAYRGAKRTIKEKMADRQNIETVVKAVEQTPEILDQPEIASMVDELEATIKESINNPDLQDNEVEWSKSTADRINRAKVGRGKPLQKQEQEPAVLSFDDMDNEPNFVYTSKYGRVEVIDSDGGMVTVKNEKGTEFKIGQKAFESMITEEPADSPNMDSPKPSTISTEQSTENPTVWYHGTNKDFEKFDASKNIKNTMYGGGFYFTDSKKVGENYALNYKPGGEKYLVSANVSASKVFDYDNDVITPEQLAAIQEDEYLVDDIIEIDKPIKLGQLPARYQSAIPDIVTRLGYDALKFKEKDGTSIAVYDERKIKIINREKLGSQATESPTTSESVQAIVTSSEAANTSQEVTAQENKPKTQYDERVLRERERFVENLVKDSNGRMDKENAGRLADELINAIENADFDLLNGRLNRGNKNSLKLFSAVTGLPTNTDKVTNESLRRLDEKKYDAWKNDKAAKRADEAEKEKYDYKESIANSRVKPIRIEGKVYDMSLRDFYNKLIEDGYKVKYTNIDFGRFELQKDLEKGLVSVIDTMKVFDKEQRKWIRETYAEKERMDEEAEYNALPDEEKTDIDKLFGFSGYQPEQKESEQPVQEQGINSPYKDKTRTLAEKLWTKLGKGEKINNTDLFKLADEVFGGTQAKGTYTVKDAYDSLELAVNLYILNDKKSIDVESMQKLLEQLPTPNTRTKEMEDYQQFSTPPSIAYVANWVANTTDKDVMLEPSAGIGGLAVFAKKAGAKVYVNEFSERRLQVLKNMPFDGFFNENAEQLNNVLPDEVKPTVVVMNPPFSATAGRMGDKTSTKNAKSHVEQALKRLQPNGRLVAIVGKGMSYDSPTFKSWWKELESQYTVRANIGINGKNYTKYGTSFDIQMFVIDKIGPTQGEVLTGSVDNIADLPKMLEGIRNERIYGTESNQSKDGVNSAGTGNEETKAETRPNKDDTAASDRGSESKRPDSVSTSSSDGNNGTGRPATVEASGENLQAADTTVNTNGDGKVDSGKGKSRRKDSDSSRNNDRESDGESTAEFSGDGIAVQAKTKSESVDGEVDENAVYTNYMPQKVAIKGAKEHASKLVQSAAMAVVEPPTPTYSPKLSKEIVEKGILSLPQLESVVYAGQAHSEKLASGERKGFFIGDGTGVGKGRQISGIIMDNYNQGRKKAIWLSNGSNLFPDAIRDWTALGGSKEDVFLQGKIKSGAAINRKDGILFSTYPTLRSGSNFGGKVKKSKTDGSRMQQIIDWVGNDYDGVIVFDEAHNMGNAVPTEGSRGKKSVSEMALAGIELQKQLPNARVVYASATGATEVNNLAYATRLGLWGEGTAFNDVRDFITKISAGGLAAMELIARDMKAMGVYIARNISFDGVEYDTVQHDLNPMQEEIYNTLTDAWQIVLQNIEKALEVTGQAKNGLAASGARSQFWSSNQRFFNQIITSMSMPSVIANIKKEIASGNAVVIQIVNTNQAAMERQLANATDENVDLEDIDLTPTDTLVGLLEKSFPVQQYEEYADDDGKIRTRPVFDSQGKPVLNKEMVAKRDELIAQVSQMKVPDGPLELLLDTFGAENVAEVTGRTRRVVYKKDEKTGQRKRVIENRTSLMAEADANAFQDDKKQILIFSDAGGTGKSYHADRNAKNQRRRIHYLLQPGWNAFKATQGIGRTHRSNQVSAPIFRLVSTNLSGQKRFISTIARRLDQLGALTKGQRQAGSGIFSEKDNLEGPIARDTLRNFYVDLFYGKAGVSSDVLEKMGLKKKLTDSKGGYNDDETVVTNIAQFLNRLLNLGTEDQNAVFTAFNDRLEANFQRALALGQIETGLENYKAEKIEFLDETVINTTDNGAETKYIQLKAYKKYSIISVTEAKGKDNFVGFSKINDTGEVVAVYTAANKTLQDGSIKKQYKLVSPMRTAPVRMWVEDSYNEKTAAIEKDKWAESWKEQIDKLPKYNEETLHMLTGALLPVWNKLPEKQTRVLRVIDNKGNTYLGRLVDAADIDSTLAKFNSTRTKEVVGTQNIFDKVLKENKVANLENRMKLMRRRVSGEYRIEITGPNLWYIGKIPNIISERINYNYRYFIPTDPEIGVPILDAILKNNALLDFGESFEAEKETTVPDYLKGRTPDYQKMGIVPKGMKVPITEKLTFDEFEADGETVEQAHKRNVLKPESMLSQIKGFALEFKDVATRTFRYIDENKSENAEFWKEMINYKKIGHQAKFKATKMLENIILPDAKQLSKEEYSRFERYILLRDLMEDYKEGRPLPYPYTEQNIEAIFDKVNGSMTERIMEAVKQRDANLEQVKNDYIKAMAKVGFNVADRFTKKAYFRHQVLEYFNRDQMLKGSGSRVKVSTNRGQFKQRHGTELSINEDYLQAEYEVLFNMMYDTAVGEMFGRIRKLYDQTKKLRAEAKAKNKAGLNAIIRAELEKQLIAMGENPDILNRYSYKDLKTETGITSDTAESYIEFNKKIAINFSKLQQMAKLGELWDDNGRWANAVNVLAGGNVEETDQTMQYIADLASVEEEATPNARAILKAISNREEFIKKLLGSEYYQWKNGVDERLIPDGYSKWQPIQGKHMMMVNTVTDQMAEVIMKLQLGEEFKDIELKERDFKINNMLAFAGDRMTFIIPDEYAATLDKVYSNLTDNTGHLKLIWGNAQTMWKRWVLTLNPKMFVKYNARNLVGDLDILISAAGFNPLKYTKRSMDEVYKCLKYGQFTNDLLEFFERGGFESNIIVQEIADVSRLKIFDSVKSRTRAEKLMRLPATYAEYAENLSKYRETLLRYAAYLHYKETLHLNGGKPDFYGASNPAIIDGLKSVQDKAFQMANDTLGAYDQVTELGQGLRRYVIPFYSFNEVQFKRYFNLIRNAKNLTSVNEAMGKSMERRLKISVGVKGLAKLGWIGLRVFFITNLLWAWNRLARPDDDDKLPDSVKNTPHITFGHNSKGEVIYFSRLGSLNDMAEWFGLDTLAQDIEDLGLERKTWAEQIEDMAAAPLNKLVNAVSPFLKSPVELLVGKSFYPEFREPSTIRDGLGYIAQSLGLKDEYNRIAGLPMNKKYAETWVNAFIYTADPGQNAYYRILDLKQDFEHDKLGKFKTQTFSDSPKTKALYYMKLSMKYGDGEKAKKYLLQYFEVGGTEQGLMRSLDSMNPLYGLDADEAEAFMMWLTPKERKDVQEAVQWYMSLFE